MMLLFRGNEIKEILGHQMSTWNFLEPNDFIYSSKRQRWMCKADDGELIQIDPELVPPEFRAYALLIT